MIFREFQRDDINKGLLETYKEVWFIEKITDDIIDTFLSNDNYMVVCEEEGEIIGTATLHLQKKLIRNGGIAGLIEDVAIRESYRGNKLGSKLIEHLVEKAKEIGCYKVILSCFPERVEFYKRNGFKQESNTMRYSIL
jgi:glucosamine-phosphate N-acetyltransferase